MASEYKKLDSEQIIYTKKALLQSQLESLTSIKQIRNYKALRHEEILEKIKFKKILDEIQHELDVLLKTLPEPTSNEEQEIVNEVQQEYKAKHNSLEEELDSIKAKLAALQ